MASGSLVARNSQDAATLSRRASSILSLGSNPSLASTTDLTTDANADSDEPPPYSAVDVPENTISTAPAWANNDPRSASTESLAPAATDSNDARRSLILVYLNASPLPTSSFKSFPAHIHNLVSVLLADTHAVYTKIFPHVSASKPISNATDDFSEWLTPREGATTDIILLANSLSGLPTAELALLLNEDPVNVSPLRHRLVGTINFDVPFLGFHPHASRVGRSNAIEVRSPVMASNATDDGTTTVISLPNSTSSNEALTNTSTLGTCVQDMESLKQRYCRIRLLDEIDEQTRSSMTEDKRAPPRVRFANYHTACVARAVRPAPPAPSERPEKPHFTTETFSPSMPSIGRIDSLTSVATRDTELPPYDLDDAEIIDEDDEDDDLDLISEVTFDDFDDLDDLDDPLHSRDDRTDADATLVNDDDAETPKTTSSQDQAALLGAPDMPPPPPMPPMPSQYQDRSSFKAAMKGWRQDLRTYHNNLGAYHRALRSWKRTERMRLRAEWKADKVARRGEKQWGWSDEKRKQSIDSFAPKPVHDVENADIQSFVGRVEDQEQKAALERLQQARKLAYEEHRETYMVACKGERSERRRLIKQSNEQLKERLEAIKAEWKSVHDQAKVRGDQQKVERKLRQDQEKDERKRMQDLQKGERKLRQGLSKEERKLQQDKEKEERKLQQDKQKEERKWKQEQEKEQRKRTEARVKEQRKVLEEAFKAREKITGDLVMDAVHADWNQGKSRCPWEGRRSSSGRAASSSQPNLSQSNLPIRSSSEVMFDAAASESSLAGPSSQYPESINTESSAPNQVSYPPDNKGQPIRETRQTPKMRTMCLLPPKDSVTGARDPCWVQLLMPDAKDELEAHQQLFIPAPGIQSAECVSPWDRRYGTFVTDVASRIEQWIKEDAQVKKLPA